MRLVTDEGAAYDRDVEIDVRELAPQVTWGTNPGMVTSIEGAVPDPADYADPDEREAVERALAYMALEPGTAIERHPRRPRLHRLLHERAHRGSAHGRVGGRRQARPLRACARWSCPGSATVKRQAEEEGLDRIFEAAGFEWRRAGCSMCLGMNPDILAPGERCASTSNRNFEGRQGAGGRTHLVSPAMAAATAIEGHFVDIREYALEPVA